MGQAFRAEEQMLQNRITQLEKQHKCMILRACEDRKAYATETASLTYIHMLQLEQKASQDAPADDGGIGHELRKQV